MIVVEERAFFVLRRLLTDSRGDFISGEGLLFGHELPESGHLCAKLNWAPIRLPVVFIEHGMDGSLLQELIILDDGSFHHGKGRLNLDTGDFSLCFNEPVHPDSYIKAYYRMQRVGWELTDD